MKHLFTLPFISVLFLLIACNNQGNKHPGYEELLARFEEIQFDTLHIWYECDRPEGKKFVGKQLDTLFFPLFGSYMNAYKDYYLNHETNTLEYSGSYLYPSYKFRIDSNTTGLILRTPSEYTDSSIDLWLYDERKDTLRSSVYLADHFGDGTFYFYREAWIIRTKNGIEIVTRQVDHEIDLEKDKDEVTQDLLDRYVWQAPGKFVKQPASEIDKRYFTLYCSEEPGEVAPSLNFTNFTYHSLLDPINADFNGDGVSDTAVFREENGKKGIVLTDGKTKKQTRFGLGISFGAGGDNFDWVDHWGLVRDSTTFEVIVRDDEVVGDTTVRLLNPSIYVGREEVGGGVITYRAGKYMWVHQAD